MINRILFNIHEYDINKLKVFKSVSERARENCNRLVIPGRGPWAGSYLQLFIQIKANFSIFPYISLASSIS